MGRLERFKFLQLFGDGKPHNWFEIVFLGVNFLKVRQDYFEKLFKTALAYNLIAGQETPEITRAKLQSSYMIDWKMYNFIITPKGDECLRNEQIARAGQYDYYKEFDRTVEGDRGLNHFSPLPNGFHKLEQGE